MHYQPHIRFVNTHTKGIGRYHNPIGAPQPSILPFIFFAGLQSSMVVGCCIAIFYQLLGQITASLSVAGIYNTGAAVFLQQLEQAQYSSIGMQDFIGQVRTEETHTEDILFLEVQILLYIPRYLWRCCGSKSQNRTVRFHLPDISYLQV